MPRSRRLSFRSLTRRIPILPETAPPPYPTQSHSLPKIPPSLARAIPTLPDIAAPARCSSSPATKPHRRPHPPSSLHVRDSTHPIPSVAAAVWIKETLDLRPNAPPTPCPDRRASLGTAQEASSSATRWQWRTAVPIPSVTATVAWQPQEERPGVAHLPSSNQAVHLAALPRLPPRPRRALSISTIELVGDGRRSSSLLPISRLASDATLSSGSKGCLGVLIEREELRILPVGVHHIGQRILPLCGNQHRRNAT